MIPLNFIKATLSAVIQTKFEVKIGKVMPVYTYISCRSLDYILCNFKYFCLFEKESHKMEIDHGEKYEAEAGVCYNPANIYLFKVNNRSTRKRS